MTNDLRTNTIYPFCPTHGVAYRAWKDKMFICVGLNKCDWSAPARRRQDKENIPSITEIKEY